MYVFRLLNFEMCDQCYFNKSQLISQFAWLMESANMLKELPHNAKQMLFFPLETCPSQKNYVITFILQIVDI